MKIHLSENIRYYRIQMGMTQQELAEKLNGKRSLICNYERGYSTPDIYTICRLAEIFDISLNELVEYQNPDTK